MNCSTSASANLEEEEEQSIGLGTGQSHAGIGEKGSARDALAMRRKIRFVGVHGCSTDRHKVIVIEEHQHKVAARVRRAGLGDRWLRGNRCD